MKIDWKKNYTTIAVYCFLVIAAAIAFLLILLNLGEIFSGLGAFLAILSPFIWGFAIAYILNRPLTFFEKKVYASLSNKKPRPKLVRALSVTTVYLLFLALLAGLLWIIIPGLLNSISGLFDALPSYLKDFSAWLQNLVSSLGIKADIQEFSLSWEKISAEAWKYIQQAVPDIANAGFTVTVGVINFAANFFIALISSIYLQLSKNVFILQTKKIMFALLPVSFAERMITVTRRSHNIFSGFISGKLLEALIVGLLTFLCMTIAGIPYAMLISVIMGVFNVIPFFGPFIGAVPSVLLLLIVKPSYALWFIIITIILQQLDAQVIGPKVLGDSTGLTAFWVIFAIILGGGLFGVLGMILGIPVFALLYSLGREFINSRLKKKNLSTRAEDYRSDRGA